MESIDTRIAILSKELAIKLQTGISHTSLGLELIDFKEKLTENHSLLETAYAKANARLKEFNRLRQSVEHQSAVAQVGRNSNQTHSDISSVSPSETDDDTTDDLDPRFISYLADAKRILTGFNGKLVQSDMNPSLFFENSKYGPAKILHPRLGISRCVVMLSELISAAALEEPDESDSENLANKWPRWRRRTIEMIIEYYVCVAPILFRESPDTERYENDCIFLEHILRHIHMDKR